MFRSALIIGAISFVYLLVANVAMMPCTPFLAIILGILAGALAVIIDKPMLVNKAVVSGALAGLIAGVGAVAGNMAGLAIRVFVIYGPETFSQMLFKSTGVTYTATDTNLGIGSLFCCCAGSDLVIMAAMGALGGYLWHRWKSRKTPAAQPPLGLS